MLDSTKLEAYLAKCKLMLGDEWLKQAEKTVIGYDSIASIAKRWCIHCYINANNEKECTEVLKKRFPEIK